jgi:hypothetical protein
VAQKVIVETVDDLDGSVITDGSGGTVAFSFQGKSYEIDLSSDNREKLASALDPYISKARPTGQRRRTSEPQPQRGSNGNGNGNGNRLQEIREWARSNGHKVSERGRLSAAVVEAYEAAH